jgi:hypothetical protein
MATPVVAPSPRPVMAAPPAVMQPHPVVMQPQPAPSDGDADNHNGPNDGDGAK